MQTQLLFLISVNTGKFELSVVLFSVPHEQFATLDSNKQADFVDGDISHFVIIIMRLFRKQLIIKPNILCTYHFQWYKL